MDKPKEPREIAEYIRKTYLHINGEEELERAIIEAIEKERKRADLFQENSAQCGYHPPVLPQEGRPRSRNRDIEFEIPELSH